MPNYPTKVRSATAMRIVNLDRQKFNEAVAAGHYPCAPSTSAGSVRLFHVDDLIALFFFARLLEFNVSTRRAGQLVCELMTAMRTRDGGVLNRVLYVRGTNADFFTNPPNYDPDHESKGAGYNCGTVVFTIEFYIGHITKMIADKIEYENSIVGREGVDD